MQSIRNMLGFMFVVNPLCLSGGLALFWKETKDVTIQNYSLRHINGVISLGDNSSGWKFTGFYGHLERSFREDSWMLLAHLKHFSPQPWLCVGDFNEIVDQSEKVGGASRSEHQMELFHSTLDGCNLCDLGYQGSKFTWNNYRDAAHFTKERLDRATATTKWCSLFPKVDVSVLATITLDHKTITSSFCCWFRTLGAEKKIKFEVKWNVDGECGALIKAVWAAPDLSTNLMQCVQMKLQNWMNALKSWSFSKYGQAGSLLKAKTRCLTLLQQHESPCDWAEIKTLQKEIEQLLEMEDVQWKQRSKRNWFRGGGSQHPIFSFLGNS
ncbi:hypothetical protein SLA2020_268910 [Shorea laevis]